MKHVWTLIVIMGTLLLLLCACAGQGDGDEQTKPEISASATAADTTGSRETEGSTPSPEEPKDSFIPSQDEYDSEWTPNF